MSVSLRGGDDMHYPQKALTGPNNYGQVFEEGCWEGGQTTTAEHLIGNELSGPVSIRF